MSDTGESNFTESTSWRDLFPYDTPYDQQQEAIERVRDVAGDDGFVLLEGACGTGKTLIALTAGLEAVRDPTSKYKRVVCMTSVKQQLAAFEGDLKAINSNLPENAKPIRGLSIVGKPDMCSYVDTGYIDHSDIYNSCETLRDQVRNRVNSANDEIKELDAIIGAWTDGSGTLEGDNWSSPYSTTDPEEHDSPPGCAFYAEYLKQRRLTGEDEPVFNLNGVYKPQELMDKASEHGMCPHAVMADSLNSAEVIIGNYRHVFDPVTVQAMTASLLDDDTFVVCDEAHTMIEVVRGLLTEEVSLYALNESIREIDSFILNPETDSTRAASEVVLQELQDKLNRNRSDTKQMVAIFRNMVEEIRDELVDYAEKAVKEKFGSRWRSKLSDDYASHTVEYPLREPDSIEQDELTDWIESSGYKHWDEVEAIGHHISESLRDASKIIPDFARVQTYSDTVGRVLQHWQEADNETFFREVELTRRQNKWKHTDHKWNEWYRAKFAIKNCIPREGIGQTLDLFGGGILMSATLEPFDAFREETGLDEIDREIEELAYGLNFPEENRESIIADLPKFTYKNRGDTNETNNVRKQYAQILRDVAETTEGNVLVGMPSYYEGKWAADILRDTPGINKEVLLDESSKNKETEQLKRDFFEGEGKILVTSMRGTLTEGVDYPGDKLSACVICGLPIRGMGSPHATAIETAYKNEFGDFQGFAFAFAVPALRKARQALGRVIRSDEDVGVRVMADARYASGYLRGYMPDYEKSDYRTTDPMNVSPILNSFWRRR